jgi:hypothetical protein
VPTPYVTIRNFCIAVRHSLHDVLGGGSGGAAPSGSPAGGFLQGFQSAQLGTPSAYFPYGAAQCCAPTLLHASGDARPLHR